GRPNPDALRLDASAVRRGTGRRHERGLRGSGRRVLATPGRLEVVELLADRSMLPAIYFIFSRNQCDEAALACRDAGVVLTEPHEQRRIREIIDDRLRDLDADDLEVLGFQRFASQLEAGIAAHHAGMVPPFKEVVERCFAEGLVKVVFATETLAVGINMPARSVVIEKLTKFTGDRHDQLTPGQFTQLTGRAGRRGIDEIGYALVLWSPFVRFDQVADLAASTSFHLRSVFRPTYNMAANLVRSYSDVEAHHLLDLSFAQFQADREIVRVEARLDRQRARLAALREEARSPYGDIDDYRRQRSQVPSVGPARDDVRELALMKLRPGTVVYARKGPYRGPAAVIASARRKDGMKITTITVGGDRLQLDARDFSQPPVAIGTVGLPSVFAPNRAEYRREVARRLRTAKLDHQRLAEARSPDDDADDTGRGSLAHGPHPVEHDPDLRDRLRAATHAERVEREIATLTARATSRTHSLSDEFDAVLGLLDDLGYVDLRAWRLRPPGEMLAATFHECDLLVVEAVRAGLLDGLAPAELAGLVSALVYEHRSPDEPPPPWFPSTDVRRRFRELAELSERLLHLERARGIAEHRPPDATFLAVAHAWVAGEGFAEVVGAEELTGGDFVRTVKQLIDLLGQIAVVAQDPATRAAAAEAVRLAFRGVVADSSVVTR
nr:hypothetical protein [Ilumatobacteraceae bacterium]